MNKKFWTKKKVLITGLDGFKGSWLGLTLKQMGAEVYGLGIKPPWGPTIYQQYKGQIGDIPYSKVNLTDLKKLNLSLNRINPEIVFHLAAQPLVLDSYTNPMETVNSNIVGLANLLETIRLMKNRPNLLINITSDKVYLNNDHVQSFREDDKLGGKDIYSASKACSEILTEAFKKSFLHDIAVCTARAGNVIGGGDWASNRIIPDIVKSLVKKKNPEIRNPQAVRPWQHVLEPISGYIKLAEHAFSNKEFEGSWNFGPALDKPYTVSDVYSEFLKSWPSSKKDFIKDFKKMNSHPKHNEAYFLQVDSTKARTLLRWRSRLTFDESIKYTADWYYQDSISNNKSTLIKYTVDQINDYYSK